MKLIDFDSIRPIGDTEVDLPDECEDLYFVSTHFSDGLDDNILHRKRLSLARFEAQRDSIDDLLRSADTDGLLF